MLFNASDKSTSNTCWLFYYQGIRINCWTGCFTTFHIKPRLVPIAPSSSKLLWIKLQLVIPRRVLQFNKLWTRTSFDLYFVFDAKTIKNGVVSLKKTALISLANPLHEHCFERVFNFAAMISLFSYILSEGTHWHWRRCWAGRGPWLNGRHLLSGAARLR